MRKGTQASLARYFDRLTDAGRVAAARRFAIPEDVPTWYKTSSPLTTGEAMAAYLASRGKVRAICNDLGC